MKKRQKIDDEQEESPKKRMGTRTFGIVATVAFTAVLMLLFVGMNLTLSEVKEVTISREPEAILASAGVEEGKDIYMSVAYFDQRSDECVNLYDVTQRAAVAARQFEWSSCGYQTKELERGLVEFELGEGNLPVFVAGKLTSNRGLGEAKRWYETIEGKSAAYTGAFKLEYRADGAEFSYYKDEFYPLDEAKFSDGDVVNKDGHNHLFTMNFALPFTVGASGEEAFEVTADDDTWVFVGDKLVIDMGGIHDKMDGRFEIRENGEIYAAAGGEEVAFTGVTVAKGEASIVRIYHADRDAGESTFGVKTHEMNVGVVETQLAKRGESEAVQVAYDPTDSGYEAPLGQSVVIQPDNSKGFAVMLTIEGVLIVAFSVLVSVAAKVALRKRVK